jgi:uncharacterized protein
MKLEQSFEIQAPLDQVWEALIDLERVAPCLPGAAITQRDEDGTYHGTFVVKLGPTTASYNGTVRFDDIDAESHTATLNAKGTDKRGQGGATATIVNRLSAVEGGTRVDASTDMAITGRLARFGRPGMMQDISNRMMREFATCLQERLVAREPSVAATPEAAAAGAAPDISADLVAEGREAAGVTPMATSPTGAPTAMAGGPLAAAAATDTAGGVSGARGEPPKIEAAPPVEGLSLMAGVLGDQVKRNSTPIGAALGVLLLLLAVVRRRRR